MMKVAFFSVTLSFSAPGQMICCQFTSTDPEAQVPAVTGLTFNQPRHNIIAISHIQFFIVFSPYCSARRMTR